MGQCIRYDELAELGNRLRGSGKQIVFTNGHFDLLHIGHLRYLQRAREYGDCLVVGVNDDAMTAKRKGRGRPILPEEERAELLAGLGCVDYVVIFPQETATELVRMLRPDVYVKGGDYATTPAEIDAGKQPLPEAEVVHGYGGQVKTVPLIEGQSTSTIEQRIIDRICSARIR